MNTSIFYFSATGNSLYAAKKIASMLEECELISISAAVKEENFKVNSERVCFVFPVYFKGLPEIVERFVKKMNMKEVKYVYAIATLGLGVANSLEQLNNILRKKNKKISAGFFLQMPGNYIRLFNVRSQGKVDKILSNADEKIKEIGNFIKQNKEIEFPRLKKIQKFKDKIIYLIWRKARSKLDKGFNVDNNCNSCGICQSICPSGNIEITNGRPSWKHKCQDCLSCIHNCPQRAIQIGKKTNDMRRYRHPQISVNELMNK